MDFSLPLAKDVRDAVIRYKDGRDLKGIVCQQLIAHLRSPEVYVQNTDEVMDLLTSLGFYAEVVADDRLLLVQHIMPAPAYHCLNSSTLTATTFWSLYTWANKAPGMVCPVSEKCSQLLCNVANGQKGTEECMVLWCNLPNEEPVVQLCSMPDGDLATMHAHLLRLGFRAERPDEHRLIITDVMRSVPLAVALTPATLTPETFGQRLYVLERKCYEHLKIKLPEVLRAAQETGRLPGFSIDRPINPTETAYDWVMFSSISGYVFRKYFESKCIGAGYIVEGERNFSKLLLPY